MTAAEYTSKRRLGGSQLMVVSRAGKEPRFAAFAELRTHLNRNDLLVMNTSATVPASLWAERFTEHSPRFEVRLAAYDGDGSSYQDWWAVTFGEGDWHRPTEKRGPPPALCEREVIWFSNGLTATVLKITQGRLLRLHFNEPDALRRIYELGRPIQYSYHRDALEIWDIQTALAQQPVSVEPPSALIPFDWRHLMQLGVETAYVLHGAGLSSTGEPALDALLPLPEYFRVPFETAQAIARAQARGGRVIAVGTTVARALESAARMNRAAGITELKLGPETEVRVVDGLLTGYHDPGTSHFQLEQALLPRPRLESAYSAAQAMGFMGHEFGDAVLIL
jgi:S-adenosylmethionine:tRNA ribosyltransferase-isomerase